MGIKQLNKMIGDNAPSAIKEVKMETYFGRKVAVDTSMSIYQFLIAMQRPDGTVMLTNDSGETTSHLQGLMTRTAKMCECGIKPVFVFDGRPPELKQGTLDDRKEKREASDAKLAEAKEAGDQETVEKMSKRTVRVSKEITEDAKTLLRLMGMPVVEAPTEAEAQCAELCKKGQVHAVVSEDMDTLTFGAPIMIRHLFEPEKKKIPVNEITLSKVLEGLEMNMTEFIDLCILMGCDYCDTLKGVGPKTAQTLIQKHKSIEEIIKNIDKTKHPLPERFNHEEIHAFFANPEVTPAEKLVEDKILVWSEPDEAGLRKFLCDEKQFDKTRIDNLITRLKKARGTSTQGRLDNFFSKLPTPAGAATKRPADKDAGSKNKKAKGGNASIFKKKK